MFLIAKQEKNGPEAMKCQRQFLNCPVAGAFSPKVSSQSLKFEVSSWFHSFHGNDN